MKLCDTGIKPLLLVLAFSITACKSQEVRIINKHNDGSKQNFTIELRSKLTYSKDTLSIAQTIEFNYLNMGDTININSFIRKIAYKDGSTNEKLINNDYQRYVDAPLSKNIDRYGKFYEPASTNAANDASKIFNIALLILEFPNHPIKAGDTWQGKRKIEDITFSYLETKYVCEEINNETTKLKVTLKFIGDDKMFRKEFNGYYVVDNKEGNITDGKLIMSGSNGFSNINGEITIRKIN